MNLQLKWLFSIILSSLIISIILAFSFSGFDYPLDEIVTNKEGIENLLGDSWCGWVEERYVCACGHLGEDYFIEKNSSVYAVADGIVFKVANWPACPGNKNHGWGGVLVIKHEIPKEINETFDTKDTILQGNPDKGIPPSPATSSPKVVYSLYGHLKKIQVKENQSIKKGDKIGEIAEVCYLDSSNTFIPHLHFEIKDQEAIEKDILEGIGKGYFESIKSEKEDIFCSVTNYAPHRYKPLKFIENNKDLIITEKPPIEWKEVELPEEEKSIFQKIKDIPQNILESVLNFFEEKKQQVENAIEKQIEKIKQGIEKKIEEIIMGVQKSIQRSIEKELKEIEEGCFIATAVYGTPLAPEIDILRDFRDEVLLKNALGKDFVKWYYKNSPPAADFIAEHSMVRLIVREATIKPIVKIVESTKSIWER